MKLSTITSGLSNMEAEASINKANIGQFKGGTTR